MVLRISVMEGDYLLHDVVFVFDLDFLALAGFLHMVNRHVKQQHGSNVLQLTRIRQSA
jgi:hypothetical protein